MTYSDGAMDVVEVDETRYDGVANRRPGHHGRGGHHGQRGHRYGEVARLLAEALGTFMLTIGILISFIFAPMYGTTSLNWLIFPIVAAVMLMAAMSAVGHVSGTGGDFNPAVTLGKAIAGRTPWMDVVPAIIGQLFGALAAAFVAWALIPESFANLLNTNRGELLGSSAPGYGALGPLGSLTAQAGGAPETEFGLPVVFIVEVIFTALFVAVVLGATRRSARRAGNAPLIVGLTFGALYLMLWPITRGGLNPARAFGSVALAGDIELWRQLWLFALAPLLGAALAGLFYRAFHPGHLDTAMQLANTAPRVRTVYGPASDRAPYDVEDVADPVLIVDEPVDVFTSDDVADSTATAEGMSYARGEGGTLLVSDDEVDEDGDVIIFGNNASVVSDIEDE